MDEAEHELFERSVRHAMETHTAGDLDRALDELGWLDALTSDSRLAMSTIFGTQGAVNASSSALDDVLAHALGLAVDAPVTVIIPPLGLRTHPAGPADGTLLVRGLGTGAIHHRPRVAVVYERRGVPVARIVDTSLLTVRPIAGIDPQLRWVDVNGPVADGQEVELERDAWETAIAHGQRGIGHELVGAARTMLVLAREHALDRVQFDRPIGSFQAVRHRLAEAFIAIERADAVLAVDDDLSVTSARIGKALAGAAARTTARHCQQVLAGIGFTADHAFHRYLRRVLVLDQLLGSARTLTTELGEEVITARRLPVLPAL